jgi:hypothetical protein
MNLSETTLERENRIVRSYFAAISASGMDWLPIGARCWCTPLGTGQRALGKLLSVDKGSYKCLVLVGGVTHEAAKAGLSCFRNQFEHPDFNCPKDEEDEWGEARAIYGLRKKALMDPLLDPYLRIAQLERSNTWITGNTPDIPEGTRGRFIVSIRRDNGNLYSCEMDYLNRFAMPCADGSEPSDNAELVEEGEEEYYWTGWHQNSCEHCDTSWSYDSPERIVAYLPMPAYVE